MKKILLLAIAALLLVNACEKDKKENLLHQKLIGEWEAYGSYSVMRYGNKYDTAYIFYETGTMYWTFTNTSLSVSNSWQNEPYSVVNDSVYIGLASRHIKFAGDSCILTSGWGGTSDHVKSIVPLYPKGYNKGQ